MHVPLVCALPAAHPLTKRAIVGPAELDDETLISLSNFDHWRLTVESVLDGQHIKPRRRVDTFTTYTACELVSRGVGIGIVDLITAMKYSEHGMTWRPFKPDLAFDIFLMRPRHWRVPRLAEALIDHVEHHARQTANRIDEALQI